MGALRVGFQRNTPPFSYSPPDAFRPIGYSVDLALMALAKMSGRTSSGPRLEAVEVTSSTRQRLLLEGRIDIECGSTTITPSRLATHAFSRPIFRTCHRIAVKDPAPGLSEGPVRIAGIAGSTSEAALALDGGVGFEHEFIGSPSIGDAWASFRDCPTMGAIVADEIILRALTGGSGQQGISLMDLKLGGEEYGFLMRQGDALPEIDAALARVFASGEHVAALARWFVDPLPGLGFGLGMDPADAAFVWNPRPTSQTRARCTRPRRPAPWRSCCASPPAG